MTFGRRKPDTSNAPMSDRQIGDSILAGPELLANDPAAFFANSARIFAEMQRRNPAFGNATSPKGIDPSLAVHELDLYATHQGGFDYYFSEESREEHWSAAKEGLDDLELPDLKAVFAKAEQLFRDSRRSHEQEFERIGERAFGRDEGHYLKRMHMLDIEWKKGVSTLHAKLAPWRKQQGFD